MTQRDVNGSDDEVSSQVSVVTATETGPETIRFDLIDPDQQQSGPNFLFPTLREPEDLERLIEEEKEKTFANLTKREKELQVNSSFYNEVIINAQRAYTG